MQATISQCLSAIVGMNAAMLVSESERDAVLHPVKNVLMAVMMTANMMLYFIDMFILLFRYKAYIPTIILLISYKAMGMFANRAIKWFYDKTGKVVYLDDIAQEQLQLDRNNLIAPMIIKRFNEMKKVEKTENEK